MTIINRPGSENIVEKASAALSFKTLLAKKSEKDLLSILHVLFGAINGNQFIQIINHT